MVKDLTNDFDVAVTFFPAAHTELNPIEIVSGTVKVTLCYANAELNLTRLQELVDVVFEKKSAETWATYEDHAIRMDYDYMEMAAMRAEVEERVDEMDIELEDAEAYGVNFRTSS